MRLSAFAAMGCTILLFAACKKTNDDNSGGANNKLSAKAQILVDGKWQMSAATQSVNYMGKDTTIDIFDQVPDCDKDDFILFAGNGTLTVDENANKCPDDEQVETFTWALLNNDTRLALVDSNPDTFNVEISGTQFKISLAKPNSSGTPVTTSQVYTNIR